MKYNHSWILGAAGGIGSELAVMGVNFARLTSLVDIKSMGHGNSELAHANFFKADISSAKGISTFAKQSILKNGPPDAMIIAAGHVSSIPLDCITEHEIDTIYSENFRLVVLAMQMFFMHCDHNPKIGKSILVISSNSSLEARPEQPVYAAMKAGINSLIQSQALAWGRYGIRVNGIAPGTVAVPRNIAALKEKYSNFPADKDRPLGRIAHPSDLIPLASLLLDPDGLITGQIVVIDGGSNLI